MILVTKTSDQARQRGHTLSTGTILTEPVCVCVCEEGHTGFFIRLISAVRALTFLAKKIQPFLSLVDFEDEFGVLTI